MSFIETENGWVNLAHVARIERDEPKARVGPRVQLFSAAGQLLGVAHPYDMDLEGCLAPVVPAVPGAHVYYLNLLYPEERPTAENTFDLRQVPVIAWRIKRDEFGEEYAYPITISPPFGARVLIPLSSQFPKRPGASAEHAGGAVFDCNPDSQHTYSNMAEVIKEELDVAQSYWDKEQIMSATPPSTRESTGVH